MQPSPPNIYAAVLHRKRENCGWGVVNIFLKCYLILVCTASMAIQIPLQNKSFSFQGIAISTHA